MSCVLGSQIGRVAEGSFWRNAPSSQPALSFDWQQLEELFLIMENEALRRLAKQHSQQVRRRRLYRVSVCESCLAASCTERASVISGIRNTRRRTCRRSVTPKRFRKQRCTHLLFVFFLVLVTWRHSLTLLEQSRAQKLNIGGLTDTTSTRRVARASNFSHFSSSCFAPQVTLLEQSRAHSISILLSGG